MFKTNYNANQFEPHFNKAGGEILVQEGQSYTVRELYMKMKSGNVPAIGKIAIWNDNPGFEDWENFTQEFDLTDIDNMRNIMKQRQEEISAKKAEKFSKEEKALKDKLKRLQELEDQLVKRNVVDVEE